MRYSFINECRKLLIIILKLNINIIMDYLTMTYCSNLTPIKVDS